MALSFPQDILTYSLLIPIVNFIMASFITYSHVIFAISLTLCIVFVKAQFAFISLPPDVAFVNTDSATLFQTPPSNVSLTGSLQALAPYSSENGFLFHAKIYEADRKSEEIERKELKEVGKVRSEQFVSYAPDPDSDSVPP